MAQKYKSEGKFVFTVPALPALSLGLLLPHFEHVGCLDTGPAVGQAASGLDGGDILEDVESAPRAVVEFLVDLF